MNEADLEVNAEQIVSGNPEKQPSSLGKYRSQLESGKMSHCKYNECMRSLNKEQRAVVKYHRAWCKKTVAILNSGTGHQVKPYYLFLSGPGGAGKSFVIKMPRTDTLNHFCRVHEIPGDEVASLLTATTGVAAHNVGGITMHSAFALSDHGRQQSDNRGHIPGEYMQLSSNILNTMHTQLENSYVVIIDEVSMMSAHMLYSMHYHLQEIIRYSMLILDLANVWIIAVGNLYQLPACFGKKIFERPGSTHHSTQLALLHDQIWQDNLNSMNWLKLSDRVTVHLYKFSTMCEQTHIRWCQSHARSHSVIPSTLMMHCTSLQPIVRLTSSTLRKLLHWPEKYSIVFPKRIKKQVRFM